MNLAVVANTDGNFNIHSEHGDNEQAAIMEFHAYSRALWAEKSVIKATVEIVNEDLDRYANYIEYVTHEQATE